MRDVRSPRATNARSSSDVTSATNDYWLFDELIPRAAKAIEQAYANRRPATIKYAEGQEPSNFRQCWSSYPYVDDMRMPLLQAVGNDGTSPNRWAVHAARSDRPGSRRRPRC